MRRILRPITLLVTVVAAFVPHTPLAQAPPAPPYYAMDPKAPMSPSGSNPLQQQILENYRTQLLQSQHSLLQQDPSGLSRAQIDINHQLHQYGPGPVAAPTPPVPAPAPNLNAIPGR